MRRPNAALAFAALFVAVACNPPRAAVSPAAAGALAASPDHVPAGINAVQNEMRLLHEAMRDSVTAVANNQLSSIPELLHRVHRAREMTEAAIEHGGYRLPRNADQIAAFRALDESFHEELVGLLGAARSGDSTATATHLGTVMARCNGCHSQYRQ